MFGAKIVVLKDNSKNIKTAFPGWPSNRKIGKTGNKPGIPTTGKSREFQYITGKMDLFFNCNDSSFMCMPYAK